MKQLHNVAPVFKQFFTFIALNALPPGRYSRRAQPGVKTAPLVSACNQGEKGESGPGAPFLKSPWRFPKLAVACMLLLVTGLCPLYAQTIQWDKTLGGNRSDELHSLQQTSDGGYILGGYSGSGTSGDKTGANKGDWDYWVVKLDAAGNKAWDKTIGGSGGDLLRSVKQTSDGGYILGGFSGSGINGDKTGGSKGGWDYWVVKLDAAGNKVWDKTIGGSDGEFLSSLQQTSDGGFILGGYSSSGISGDKTGVSKGGYDYWVVKLDVAGNKVWDKTIGGSDGEFLSSLQQTSDGGFILGGHSNSGISGDKTEATKGVDDYWVVKLDAAGNKAWDKTIGGNSTDYLFSLQQTSDGGYVLGGYSWSDVGGDKTEASKGNSDYWVVKLDAAGNKAWDKTIGGSGYDDLRSLQQTSDGGYVLGGLSGSGVGDDKTEASRGGDYDYWVVKLDAAGNKAWDKTIGGNSNDDLKSLHQTGDGGLILGGYSWSGISGDKTETSKGQSDYWVVKLAGENSAPGAAAQALTTPEDLPLNIRLQASDAQSDPITYAIVQPPAHGTLSGTAPDLVYTPAPDYHGPDVFSFTASDGALTSEPAQVSINVSPVNDAPSLALIPNQEVEEQTLLAFTAAATDVDNPAADLLFSLAGAPAGATIDPATGAFSWTPGQDQVGLHTLTIRVTDNGTPALTAETQVSVTVAARHYTLTVSTSGNGMVMKDPDLPTYANGSTVTLTALAAPGFVFAGWQGAASGTQNPLALIINQNTEITATFTQAQATGPQVLSFSLINSTTDQVISTLNDGDVLNILTLPSRNVNIRANTSPDVVGSVKFALSGSLTKNTLENQAPYALYGDYNGNYNDWYLNMGSYTLTATPYPNANAGGTAGTPLTVSFTIIKQAASRLAQPGQPQQPDGQQQLTLYPNPTRDGRITVQLAEAVQGKVSYSLVSVVGRQVAAGSFTLTQADSLLTFDFSSQLPATGVYYLRLEGPNLKKVLKVMKE